MTQKTLTPAVDLVNQISLVLAKRTGHNSYLELMFWTAIENKVDPSEIIDTLFDNVTDNLNGVAEIIGHKMVNGILKYKQAA